MGSNGRVTYEPEIDALYVQLAEGEPAEMEALDHLRLIYYSAPRKVLGVKVADRKVIAAKFIEASQGIDLAGVVCSSTIKELIEASGSQFRVFV